jgi:hypothetical protein
MIKDGIVSIWFGRFANIEELQEYLQVNYSENVDYMVSKFEGDFSIEYFDEDLREIKFLGKPTNKFSKILNGHSYFNSIISNYTSEFGDEIEGEYNCSILLYSYYYKGLNIEAKYRKNLLRFMGSTKFDSKA